MNMVKDDEIIATEMEYLRTINTKSPFLLTGLILNIKSNLSTGVSRGNFGCIVETVELIRRIL